MSRRFINLALVLLLPVAVVAFLSIFMADKPRQEKVTQAANNPGFVPNGVWSDLPNFPNTTLDFGDTGSGLSVPLQMKRAGAAAYPPNGKIYMFGGRHRNDGNDISLRYIWEYTPFAPATPIIKSAQLDDTLYGSRWLSNMAVATLTDTNGARIYVIGGATVNSEITSTVRVYNPIADSLTTLTTDPWPANPARIPGGYAVYNNKLYIFGGYAAQPSSIVYSDTWVFNPMAAVGSKWSQLPTANLPTARAFIAGATLDGYIYAIGGDVINGVVHPTVVPVNNVERMDPNQANPVWNAKASLPTARGDMGAWAYDSNTTYEIAGKIAVAGGGYPDPDTTAYIYDPIADAWSSFPSMLRPRRNYAYTQLNGILYAWGGYNVTAQGYTGSNSSMQYNASAPAATNTPTVTGTPPTATRTFTPGPATNTPTATPTACGANTNYAIATATGATVVPGSTFVQGSNCDDCLSVVDLPFSFRLYDQTFTTSQISSNGQVGFGIPDSDYTNTCLPDVAVTYSILPHWDDLLLTGANEGVYTSVSGVAPDRIFNIEWRGGYYNGGGTVDFEVRLYENSPTGRFDVIYGTLGQAGTDATVGVQKDNNVFTQYECNSGGLTDGLQLIFTQANCGTGTPIAPTATRTSTAPPSTATPTAPIVTATSVPPTPCAISFSDVPVGSTFYAFIRCLACRGIVSGYPDGTFRPNNNVTRGQLSKIVSNSAGFNDPQTTQMFEDVPVGSTFFDFVGRLASRGFIGGYPCGGAGEPCVPPDNRPYFRPNDNATRGQLSKIVSNAAGFSDPAGAQIFEDVPPGSTFYDFIQRLASRSILGGYPCGSPDEPCVPPDNRPYFRPNDNATRGQTSKIVANTFFPNCNPPVR